MHECVSGDPDFAVIFAGSGSTGAIAKLVGILGLRIPSAMEDAYHLSEHIDPDQRPVVFIGPFEHHSNELPWRESIADVVVIPEDPDGHIDQDSCASTWRSTPTDRSCSAPSRQPATSQESSVMWRESRRSCMSTVHSLFGTMRQRLRTSTSAPPAWTGSSSAHTN